MSESGVIPRPEDRGPSYVQHLGEVSDINDVLRLYVGVDHDAVTIGRYTLTQQETEAFAQLFVAACWTAGENRARMAAEGTMPP